MNTQQIIEKSIEGGFGNLSEKRAVGLGIEKVAQELINTTLARKHYLK